MDGKLSKSFQVYQAVFQERAQYCGYTFVVSRRHPGNPIFSTCLQWYFAAIVQEFHRGLVTDSGASLIRHKADISWKRLRMCFVHNWIFFLNSRPFLPTFRSNCLDVSHFAQTGSHFVKNTTPKPWSLLSRQIHLSGICTYNTPPTRPQNTPFSGLNLKVGKINHHLGNLDPSWAKCLKVDKDLLEVGKKIIHVSFVSSYQWVMCQACWSSTRKEHPAKVIYICMNWM